MDFFDRPILNSPYEYPSKHWELDEDGQPTQSINDTRRPSSLITPVPRAKTRRRRSNQNNDQMDIILDTGDDLSTTEQEYNISGYINEIRELVDQWRRLPNERDWQVTAETAQLLRYWRSHEFETIRPFFCQVEAVETAIWLAEVAPKMGQRSAGILKRLAVANEQANPEIFRIAFKLATGAGKTTVMAMLITWQTVNAVRHPQTKSFSRAFLIVAPGITIKDRLRVLQPNDPDSYYKTRELIPSDMVGDIEKAKIVITNYHAFKLRETIDISKTGRTLLKGRGDAIQTLESEGQMIKRVMGELMSMKNIVVINDEAHHCYREKPSTEEDAYTGEERKEAEKNKEAARLWITGIEAVKRKLGVRFVYDLSATPFFLKGSGYAEGTLFPWVSSDFSLMDAIECGIVKLPRVPVSDNVARDDMPIYRNLWDHIGRSMPRRGRGEDRVDPDKLPLELKTALDALYGHYEKIFESWRKEGISVPPAFIVVCNNTATSKLVYDYISGFDRVNDNDEIEPIPGRLKLFQNHDQHGNRLSKPRTLLIDSTQLESGDALDKEFREAAAPEIERFRREILERTGNQKEADNIDDATLLREVMNTVGKAGSLGGQIRCVVSVSMLTEGWDANTVTHVLGVRAFGTQLLCEQVVGRALRRQSYELNENGFFDVEYADVLGIPFDFAAEPVVTKPRPPRETIRVRAIRERDHLEIRFPKVEGYRTELPPTALIPNFTDDHALRLSPDVVGPSITDVQGIVGQSNQLTLEHTKDTRKSAIIYSLAAHLLYNHYRDANEQPKHHLFVPLKKICRYWLDNHLECIGNTYPAQVMYEQIKDMAANKIKAAITETHVGDELVKAILDPYNMESSSIHVNFTTSNPRRYETSDQKCHINYVIGDSDWELDMAETLENSPRVLAYVKNHSLGFEVPYLLGSESRKYRPDFIVKVDDGIPGDPLNLVVEVKGYRNEAAVEKANTMKAFWVPGVNNLKKFGRWAFVEFQGDVFEGKANLQESVDRLMTSYAQKNENTDAAE
jgi:type III restriction enzyme